MPSHLPRAVLATVLATVLTVLVALAAGSAHARTTGPTAAQAGPPHRLLQLNLCLSGLAGCYPRTQYPAVVDEAVQRIEETDPTAVTLNEACSGDVERIAQRTGYDARFAVVRYRGAPLPCRNPEGRGVFGNAVLTKEHVTSSVDAAFAAQDGVEERRWICATTARRTTVCATHLSTRGTPAARAANDAQCAELGRVVGGFAAQGPTIGAGDVNRQPSCAPTGASTVTDAAARQAPGIQHAYLSADFVDARADVLPMTHTDHDALLVTSRLRVPR